MFAINDGSFFHNQIRTKIYSIVLFCENPENETQNQNIRNAMSDFMHSKIIFIPQRDFDKNNKGKYDFKPDDILLIGNGKCKKFDRELFPTFLDILRENNRLNSLGQQYGCDELIIRVEKNSRKIISPKNHKYNNKSLILGENKQNLEIENSHRIFQKLNIKTEKIQNNNIILEPLDLSKKGA